MKLSFVVSMQHTTFSAAGNGDWKEIAAYISEIGFDGIELAVKEPEKVNKAEIKEHLSRHNLKLVAIGTGQIYHDLGLSLIDANEEVRIKTVDLIKRHIELAANHGAKVIIGLIRGRLGNQSNKQLAYEFFKKNMISLDEYAQTEGVDLMIEPLNRYETDYLNLTEEAVGVINSCGLKNTGILLDTFHMNIEEPNWDKSIQIAKAYLKHIHIADSNRYCPGYGHINFSNIVKLFNAIGYEGFYSGEIYPVPDLKTAIRQYYTYMRKQ